MNFLGLSSFWFGLIFFSNPLLFYMPYYEPLKYSNVAMAETPEISWFDSRTKKGESYMLIGECFVALNTKTAVKSLCYVQKQIEKQCGQKYELEKKCD